MGDLGPWVKRGQQLSITASSSSESPGDVGPPTGPNVSSVGHAVVFGAAVGAAVGGAVAAFVGLASGGSSEVEEASAPSELLASAEVPQEE